MDKVRAATTAYRVSKGDSSQLPKHEAWIPKPEKQFAKDNGAKWNDTDKRFEYQAADPDEHPCSRFQPKNYLKLKNPIPWSVKDQFSDLGVITKKEEENWANYIMQHEDYVPVIEALMELDLL